MNPDYLLRDVRQMVEVIFAPVDEDTQIAPDYEHLAVVLAVKIALLDAWMLGDGFAPSPWDHPASREPGCGAGTGPGEPAGLVSLPTHQPDQQFL